MGETTREIEIIGIVERSHLPVRRTLKKLAIPPATFYRCYDLFQTTFERSSGPLAPRLIAALQAAEADGGDFRGQRSAAILVVRATRSGRTWRDNVVNLRVDDDGQPLDLLERMVDKTAPIAHEPLNRTQCLDIYDGEAILSTNCVCSWSFCGRTQVECTGLLLCP